MVICRPDHNLPHFPSAYLSMKITFRPMKFIAFYCAGNTSHNIFPSFRCHYFSACIIFTQFRCAIECAYNDKVLNLFLYLHSVLTPIPFCLISNGVCYVPEFTMHMGWYIINPPNRRARAKFPIYLKKVCCWIFS